MPIYKGNTKIVKLYKGTTQIIKRYKGTNIIYSSSRLPAEFQEVEYLESDGTSCWLTTQITFNTGDIIKTKSSYLIIRDFQTIYGTPGFEVYYDPNNKVYVWQNGSTYRGTIVSGQTSNVILGEPYTHEVQITNKEFPNYINIFSYNDSGSYQLKGRVFLFVVIRNNSIIHNLVPCYRKADNVAGLYDLVNGVFYTNAGTGTFIVGGNV